MINTMCVASHILFHRALVWTEPEPRHLEDLARAKTTRAAYPGSYWPGPMATTRPARSDPHLPPEEAARGVQIGSYGSMLIYRHKGVEFVNC